VPCRMCRFSSSVYSDSLHLHCWHGLSAKLCDALLFQDSVCKYANCRYVNSHIQRLRLKDGHRLRIVLVCFALFGLSVP
jgi:hypothetical protein